MTHYRFNIFGRAFSFIRNFWNDRVRTPHMKRFEKQNSNVNIDALLQEEAENLNSADVYMLLGEIYLFGNSKLGVKQNFDKGNPIKNTQICIYYKISKYIFVNKI